MGQPKMQTRIKWGGPFTEWTPWGYTQEVVPPSLVQRQDPLLEPADWKRKQRGAVKKLRDRKFVVMPDVPARKRWSSPLLKEGPMEETQTSNISQGSQLTVRRSQGRFITVRLHQVRKNEKPGKALHNMSLSDRSSDCVGERTLSESYTF